MQKTSIEHRVARGAAFMDRERPDWENNVDLSTLNLADNEQCILGQRYGEYGIGTIVLGLSMRRQYRYGFIATRAGGCAEYPDLTEAWAHEIIIRLQKNSLAKTFTKPQNANACRALQPTLS